MLNDLPIGIEIRIYYKKGYSHRPNPQRAIFLGIMGNLEIMKRFAKKGITDAFGIAIEPIDGQKTIGEDGKIIPEVIFPDNINTIKADDDEVARLKNVRRKPRV